MQERTIKAIITLSKTWGLKSSPEKVIAANTAKFFIHCRGRKSLNMLNASFIFPCEEMQKHYSSANNYYKHDYCKQFTLACKNQSKRAQYSRKEPIKQRNCSLGKTK